MLGALGAAARRRAGHRPRQRPHRLLRAACSSASTPASTSTPPVLVASLLVGLIGPPLAAAAGDPPGRPPAGARGAAGHRLGGRRPGPARRAAAPRAFLPRSVADRPARRRAAQAPHVRDGAPGRAVGRRRCSRCWRSAPRSATSRATTTTTCTTTSGPAPSRRGRSPTRPRRALASTPGVTAHPAAADQRAPRRPARTSWLWGTADAPADATCASPAGAGTRPAEAARAQRRRRARPPARRRPRRQVGDTAHRCRPPPAPRACASIGDQREPGQRRHGRLPAAGQRCRRVLGTPGRGQQLLGRRRDSKDHAYIDRLTTRLEDTLGAHGTQITTSRLTSRSATTSPERQPHDAVDHRARPGHRGHQHGRARQRDHDGRPRAHARDRDAALRRRPRA